MPETEHRKYPYPGTNQAFRPSIDIGELAKAIDADLNASNQQPLSWLKKGLAKQIIVCNSSGVPQYVTASGDVTTDESGVLTIGNEKVTSAKVGNLGLGTIFQPTYLGAAESVTLPIKKTNHIQVQIGHRCTITGLSVFIGTAAAGETHKVIIGFYDSARTLIASSGEVAVSNVEHTFVKVPFSATVQVNSGLYWASIISNGSVNLMAAHTMTPCGETLGASFALTVPEATPEQNWVARPIVASY